MPITNWGILVDGIIIHANDTLVIMSEIMMQTRAILCVIAAACTLRGDGNCALAWRKTFRAISIFKSISHCCIYLLYAKKLYNKPKVDYQNTEKKTVRARMCKKIFRAGRRATRVQISPPFTVFTLALSCIHPVFTLCLHCILAPWYCAHSVFALLHSVSIAIFAIDVSNSAVLKLRNRSVAIR